MLWANCTEFRIGTTLPYRCGGGVEDEDYRGNLCVILFNYSNNQFQIYRGDRIAQLISQNIVYPTIKVVKELDKTERDSNGFGSTGRK